MLDPPFEPACFDHLFVCFVLEHLPEPAAALERLATLVRPGGTVTVIEGDHGSAYFHPESAAAHAAIDCLVQLQAAAGGDALIGRRVYPLMADAGLADVRVSPRLVYVDDSRPDLVDGFTRKTFTAMVEGVREPAVEAGLIEADGLRRRRARPAPHGRGRRHVLVHVLQGRGDREVSAGRLSAAHRAGAGLDAVA